MDAQEIKNILKENRNQYCYFGVRAMTVNPVTEEREVAVVGEQIADSYHWEDGESTGESAGGVCALAIDADDDKAKIEDIIQNIMYYVADGCEQVVLIGSMRREYGMDPDEIILSSNDTILAVWNI
jgi:hypothetical protein